MLLRCVPICQDRRELLEISGIYFDDDVRTHVADSHLPASPQNPNSGALIQAMGMIAGFGIGRKGGSLLIGRQDELEEIYGLYASSDAYCPPFPAYDLC
jgi:hypothetical protein